MLTEADVVQTVAWYLRTNGYEIVSQAMPTQRGVDVVARRSGPRATEIRVEAKGGTSSKMESRRYSSPFTRSQVRTHVSRAFYTAAAARYPASQQPIVRSAMAFPDTELHRELVAPLAAAIHDLDLGVLWVRSRRRVAVEARWRV